MSHRAARAGLAVWLNYGGIIQLELQERGALASCYCAQLVVRERLRVASPPRRRG
jgi:hypothetical protein